MNDLEAAVALLSTLSQMAQVSGPIDFGIGPPAAPVCLVEVAGEGGPTSLAFPGRTLRYILRYYAPDNDALVMLDAFKEMQEATFSIPGVPKAWITVGDQVARWCQLQIGSGPIPEPDTERYTLLASALIKWK